MTRNALGCRHHLLPPPAAGSDTFRGQGSFRRGILPLLLPFPARSRPALPSPRPSGPARSWGRSRPWSLRWRLHFRAAPPPLPPLASASGPRHCGKCSPSPHSSLGRKSGPAIKAFHYLYVPAESFMVVLLIILLSSVGY